jgi:integrase
MAIRKRASRKGLATIKATGCKLDDLPLTQVVWLVDYRDSAGRRRFKQVSTQREAKEWLTTTAHAVQTGQHRAESTMPTIGAACEAWIKRGEAEGLEASTMRQRRFHVGHIQAVLGRDQKLSKIDLEAFRDTLVETKSRPLARKVMASFRAILKQAKVAHLAANLEPIRANGRHQRKLKVGVDIPTPAEVRALVETTADDPKALALACLAAFAGLRASELRGLAWSHLQLGNNPKATIEERADETNRIGPPKSEASKRTIGLNETTAKALRAWKVAQPPLVIQDKDGNKILRPRALVFGTAADRPDGLANIRRRLLGPAWIKAGVAMPLLDAAGEPVTDKGEPVLRPKYPGAHALRHFAISSWLKTCNGDFKKAQTRAGHATLALTLDTYGHLLDTNDGDQIDAAERLVLAAE